MQSETKQSKIQLRQAVESDIPHLVQLNKRCFPAMVEEDVVWHPSHLRSHLRLFPQGQIVATLEGQVVGAVSSLIVNLGSDPYRAHTYSGITDGGYFYNHDPQGDTLYGADVYVDPEVRGLGVGHVLYEARRELCRTLNLRRILAGGRLHGFKKYAEELSPEAYVQKVENNELRDLVLSFQLREGFVVRGILRNYITDPDSLNHASLIEWLNPDYEQTEDTGPSRNVRVACVQYQMRRVNRFEDFAEQTEYFVETAMDYRADFLVFPEFFSVQLLSQPGLKNLPALEGIAKLADMTDDFMSLMRRLATEYGIHIVAGSHPFHRNGVLENCAPLIFPDGSYELQPKLHITPSEKRYWGITGGSELAVFQTAKARVGIMICYDAEFPEVARHLVDQGAEILFVPYCTDERQGYQRVRLCSQARAVENQVYVVTTGVIGNLPSVPAMDIHYGRAGVFTPSDFEHARDGIKAEGDSNVEMMLVTDLAIEDLYRSRSGGSVTLLQDRRRDLFHSSNSLKNANLTEGHPAKLGARGPADAV